jgi:ADP-heptose:LPS heptosyltransferase
MEEPRTRRVTGVRGIAVLRANAVGDLVVALPALESLRTAYPKARISLLARAWHAGFLSGRPSPVEEVIVLPECLRVDIPQRLLGDDSGSLSRFVEAMRERRFDIALQLHGGGLHSNHFVRSLGARVSAGMQARGAPALDRNLPYRPLQREALRLLEAVALVGAQVTTLEPRVVVTDADRDEARRVLGDVGQSVLMLQPACRDPRRAWSPERFAAIGDRFASRGASVLVNGTADEAPAVGAVLAGMRHPAQGLAGRLSLGALLAVLERSRLLVSNDTGTAHLARAVGLPTVTIYWIGNLPGYAPLGSARDAVAVSWRVHCPRCGRVNVAERCRHDDSFVDDVAIDEVAELADELWALGEDGRAATRRDAA